MSADADSFQFFSSPTGIIIVTAIMVICLTMCFFCSLMEYSVKLSGILKHTDEDNQQNIAKAISIKEHAHKYEYRAEMGFLLYFGILMVFSMLGYVPPTRTLLQNIGMTALWADITAFLADFILITLLAVTIGRFIPQKLALYTPENTLAKYAGLFVVISLTTAPLADICSTLSDGMNGLLGHSSHSDTKSKTEEKIMMMVDEGEENGSIEENTRSMIENVFDFDDTTVGEIMTHRKDVIAVADNAQITDLTRIAIQSGRSRIPVYHEDIDNIIGIINVKDLLKYVSTNAPSETVGKDIIREAVYVPQSKRCSEMFEYMTKSKVQIAVVVDEFGGTGGIITMEDLIESILGSIQDEYDNEEEDIKKVNENSFKVDGATSLDEISDLTGIDFDDEEDDTIAGVMLDRMGHIPKNGEHPSIMIDDTRFTVLEVDNRRISKILVVKKNKIPDESPV